MRRHQPIAAIASLVVDARWSNEARSNTKSRRLGTRKYEKPRPAKTEQADETEQYASQVDHELASEPITRGYIGANVVAVQSNPVAKSISFGSLVPKIGRYHA